jgi:hypothetical protein
VGWQKPREGFEPSLPGSLQVFLRNNFLGKKPASQTPAYLALSFFTFAFPAGCSAKLKRIGQDWLPAYGSQSQSGHRMYPGLLLSYPQCRGYRHAADPVSLFCWPFDGR